MQAKADMVENENQEYVVMVIGLKGLQICMVIEVQIATTKFIGWWVDFGASVHVCNDRAQFKSYEEAIDKKVLMGSDSETKVVRQGTVEL